MTLQIKQGIQNTGFLFSSNISVNNGYKVRHIPEHRLVFEYYHQCVLLRWGVVHHINGNKEDNRPENLEGMTRSQHRRVLEPKFITKSDMRWSIRRTEHERDHYKMVSIQAQKKISELEQKILGLEEKVTQLKLYL